MPPEPSASYPSYTRRAGEGARSDAPPSAAAAAGVRLALAAWAALVYLIYWLGYLGVR